MINETEMEHYHIEEYISDYAFVDYIYYNIANNLIEAF